MKNDPSKYSRLIYYNTSSAANYNSQDYDAASYGQQQQQYPSQAYTDMLLEEAEKLYIKLAKGFVDDILSDYASNISSTLPLLQTPFDGKEQQLHVMPGIAVLNSEKFKVISHMRDTLDYGLVSMPI
jgi:hypothetical protein